MARVLFLVQKSLALFMLVLAGAKCGMPAPLALLPRNTHYFLFRGKPTVLVTSGEHYGSVINQDFNYVRYLDELQRNHLNLTRIWVGPYREVAGSFHIADNTLAPLPGRFIAPWPRSHTPGAADGQNRFDLAQWNPAYFARLHDFIQQASVRGIVVEVNLFCPYYEPAMWQVSPLNSINNVNAAGNVARTEVLTMKHPGLLAIEDAMVRKIVSEVNAFDNIYFEICNEPYFGGVALDWQQHIARTLAAAEERLPHHHLISQNIANGTKLIETPFPQVSLFNFHYCRPPGSVALNYNLDRPIGNNETGFDGQADATYRIQGWDFLAAGGALYNNLDYSFTVGHEGGDFHYPAATPGGGSAALRKQLGILKDSFDSLDLTQMKPADSLARPVGPAAPGVRVLASATDYLIYINEAHITFGSKPKYVVDSTAHKRSFALYLAPGSYQALWLNTKTGALERTSHIHHAGGERRFESPTYYQDIVLRVHRL